MNKKAKKPSIKPKAKAPATEAEVPVQKVEEKQLQQPRRAHQIETPRGMRDILPEEQNYWEHIRAKAEELAAAYGYRWISTPIVEQTDLFTRPLGKESDVVEKEMYTFVDRGGDSLTLRPEGTAGVARAYVNHGMLNQPQPVKFFYWGPMFRYDRPQKGRYRQFHQFGLEVIGSHLPIVDAELIVITYNFYKELGLETKVQINSIGMPESRKEYTAELVSYYRTNRNKICEDCKRRLLKNPLRVLDCKEEMCQPIKDAAPQIIDWLDEESKSHFMKVLEYLDEVGIPYELNHRLVRGFDYYTRTVFEFYLEGVTGEAAQSALCGGGRYDLLIELLGGNPTAACGVAPGIERVIIAMKEKGLPVPSPKKPRIFLAQLGEQARVKALGLFEEFRKAGIQIVQSFAKESLKAQMEIANKNNVPYTLILGQKEVLDGTVLIRDMDGGNQETVDMKKVVGEVKKKLKMIEVED